MKDKEGSRKPIGAIALLPITFERDGNPRRGEALPAMEAC